MTAEPTSFDHKLLSTRADERLAAPADVWDFVNHKTWHAAMWTLIDDFTGPAVRKAFLRKPPEYVVSDDLTWLDDIVRSTLGIEVDSKEELADRLMTRYRALRAYHGTSATSLEPFYTQGLRPLVIEEYHQRAREVFLSGQYPELSEGDLQRAIEEVGPETREGRVYFEANEHLLTERCGHYFLYGSEYLVAIAAHLGERRDYRRALKGVGRPTLLVCDVPMRQLRRGMVLALAGMALEAVFQELIDGEGYAPSKWRGIGFSISEPLHPACLVGHCHPTNLQDPLTRFR